LYTFPQTVVYLLLVVYERLQCTTVLLYLLFSFVYYFKTWRSARSFVLNRYQMILSVLTLYIYEYFSYRWYITTFYKIALPSFQNQFILRLWCALSS